MDGSCLVTMAPFGFWTMPWLNLSLCAIPKGGSTMNRQIVARAAGHISPERGQCFYNWDVPIDQTKVHMNYSPNTTNVVIVRDPWDRAVSSYADQKRRGHISENVSFGEFLDHHAMKEYDHHTGLVANKCIGHKGARFDHVIRLSDISSFARVAREVPAYGRLIETGWEKCTGGDPRLYMPGSIAVHRNKDVLMPQRLCTPSNIAKVCAVYREDYLIYQHLGSPFPCECSRIVTG